MLYRTTGEKKQYAAPLCHAEFILKLGKNMPVISDGTIFSLQFHLRHSLPHLRIAGKIASLLYETQLENKPAPALFILVIRTLQKLPEHDPHSMLACFLLKLLIHEGIFSKTDPNCILTEEEWNASKVIVSAKHFAELPLLNNPHSLLEKLLQWTKQSLFHK